MTLTPTKVPTVWDNLTILLFGGTGSGKTPMIGELAEYFYKTQKKRTRLNTADKGGWVSIRPYVELGIIDLVELEGDPFVWTSKVVKGMKLKNGVWVDAKDPDIVLYAFEGFTSICAELMTWMAQASARGVNIGGQGSFNFQAGTGKDSMKVGSNNQAHFGVAQQQVYEYATQSQSLPGTILWTAGDSAGKDDASGGVIGPQLVGKAKTPEVPQWFKYTFHLVKETLPGEEKTKHTLHMRDHVEMNSVGMSVGISNARVPLAGEDTTPIPAKIEPASIVKALELLESRQTAAKDAIKIRLGL